RAGRTPPLQESRRAWRGCPPSALSPRRSTSGRTALLRRGRRRGLHCAPQRTRPACPLSCPSARSSVTLICELGRVDLIRQPLEHTLARLRHGEEARQRALGEPAELRARRQHTLNRHAVTP